MDTEIRISRLVHARSLKWFNRFMTFGDDDAMKVRFSPGTTFSFDCKIHSTALAWNPKTQTGVFKLVHTSGVTIIMKHVPMKTQDQVKKIAMEVRCLRVFVEFMKHAVSCHFVLPMGTFEVTGIAINQLQTHHTVSSQFHKVILAEAADGSLFQLIRNRGLDPYELKVILFQVLYTLHVICFYYPNFRHHDLHLANVLYLTQPRPLKTNLYHCVGHTFYHNLGRCPYRMLLWDMYFGTVIPNHESKSYGDVHKFVDSLLFTLSLTGTKTKPSIDCMEFLTTVVPEHLRLRTDPKTLVDRQLYNQQQYINSLEYITIESLLTHEYFRELRLLPRLCTTHDSFSIKTHLRDYLI